MAYDSLLRLPYGISKRLNFPAQSLQQASRQLVGVMSHTQFTFWNKSTSKYFIYCHLCNLSDFWIYDILPHFEIFGKFHQWNFTIFRLEKYTNSFRMHSSSVILHQRFWLAIYQTLWILLTLSRRFFLDRLLILPHHLSIFFYKRMLGSRLYMIGLLNTPILIVIQYNLVQVYTTLLHM